MKRIKKVLMYLKGLINILIHTSPIKMLKLASGSDVVIKQLDEYGFSIFLRCDDYAVAKPILFTQHYEEHVAKTLQRYLKLDSVFIDVGANVGFFSLLAGKNSPKGKVYSFEPDSNNYRLLRSSVIYNDLDQIVETFPFAVSDKNETLVLSDLGCAKNTGARFTAKNKEQLKPLVHGPNPVFGNVKAVSIDDFIKKQNVDLIKIDIEGYEPFAFRGMESTIKTFKPVIVTEFAPGNLRSVGLMKPELFIDYIRDLGYSINLIKASGDPVLITEKSSCFVNKCISQSCHHVDLLLLPEEQ